MLDQGKDMKNLTSIDVNPMEPCFLFNCLLPSMSPPEYWRHFGSSKNRSTEQAESGKQRMVRQYNQVFPSVSNCQIVV
jgi:hypothetical protein